MEVTKIKIDSSHGLHLRPAARIVRVTQKFKSKIIFCHNCKLADSCSILELLGLAAEQGTEIAVIVDGPDEKEAIKEINQFFSDGAGI